MISDKLKELAVVIPTHKRSNKQITLECLPKDMQEQCVILVCTKGNGDAEILKSKYPHVKIVEADVDTIAKKRQWILEHCKSRNKIIMLDDDLKFRARVDINRRDPATGYLKLLPEFVGTASEVPDGNKICRAFEQISLLLDRYAHGGIESAQSNSLQESLFVEGDMEWHENWRACLAVAYRRDVFLEQGLNFTSMPLREDMYITARLLSAGYPNFSLLNMAVAAATFGSDGGCADERTLEYSNKMAVELANMFPKYIKSVDKQYTSGPDRTEVRVAWKKMYKDAPVKREVSSA